MPKVETARHLHRFFPGLAAGAVALDPSAARTAADVVRAMDARFPGFAGYIVDERGALRMHVNLFINGEMVLDRPALTDRIPPDATVYILQALSGG